MALVPPAAVTVTPESVPIAAVTVILVSVPLSAVTENLLKYLDFFHFSSSAGN